MDARKRSSRYGFTLIELLVVISIIAMLMAILMPSLSKAKDQARAVMCLSRLKQWGLIFSMYTMEYNGKFHQGYTDTEPTRMWAFVMQKYYTDDELRYCPATSRPYPFESGTGREEWLMIVNTRDPENRANVISEEMQGSYCINRWLTDAPGVNGPMVEYFWRNNNVKGTSRIPMFGDGWWFQGMPQDTDTPPEYNGQRGSQTGIGRFAINRHKNMRANLLFMDQSVQQPHLRDLWGLKWHRTFDTANRYASGEGTWPDWMLR